METNYEVLKENLLNAKNAYQRREGQFLMDNARNAIDGLLRSLEKKGKLRDSERAFAEQLIRKSRNLKETR